MNFSEQPPSKQWAPLKYRGETFAEVWFKPEGEPFSLTFRIPQKIFQIPGVGQRLSAETLLRSVGIALDEVESWGRQDAADSSASGNLDELTHSLAPPSPEATHLLLHVHLKAPTSENASTEVAISDVSESKWQDLEARWNAILSLEASVDTLRISMESLRAEMENSSRRTLSTEEKLNALNADVLQWNKAKTRVLHALPKVREFIHRSTWAVGAPERKKLEEIFKNFVRPRLPFPEMDQVMDQLDNLLKDRQVLSAHGTSVYQECKSIAGDVQGALSNLQSNARSNAVKKRGATHGRGK